LVGDRHRVDVVVTAPGPDNVVHIATTDDLPATLTEAALLELGERLSFRLRTFVGEDWSEGA